MPVATLLLIVIALAVVGALPTWPYSGSWGYAPSGVLAVALVVVLGLFLMGHL
jgi:hypothetical protein